MNIRATPEPGLFFKTEKTEWKVITELEKSEIKILGHWQAREQK